MHVFTIHEAPNAPADRIDRGERLEFIRDGFNPLAAVLPPLWMIGNRLWLALLIYLIGITAMDVGLNVLGLKAPVIAVITMATNLLVGFEADSIKRWTLRRSGWSEIGTVVGRNKAECERRFFDNWLTAQPAIRQAATDATDRFFSAPRSVLPRRTQIDTAEPPSTSTSSWLTRFWPRRVAKSRPIADA